MILGTILAEKPRLPKTPSRNPEGTIIALALDKLGLTHEKALSKKASASPPPVIDNHRLTPEPRNPDSGSSKQVPGPAGIGHHVK